MIYDCRPTNPTPGAGRFPGPVKVVDPATGERIPNVFFLDTATARIGRFVTDAAGQPMVDTTTRRKRVETDPETGKVRAVIEYDRLEIWEHRPWVAVAVKGDEVVAKSEGAP